MPAVRSALLWFPKFLVLRFGTLVAVSVLISLNAWASTPTTTTLTLSSGSTATTSVKAGAVVTLTANVAAGGTPVSPGLVKFCDATAGYCSDMHLLGTAQLTASGTATLKFVPGIGSHSYNAIFAGTHVYAPSTSQAEQLTVAGKYPSTTSIASSGSAGSYNLTATVVGSGSRIAPTGTVSFQDTTNANYSIASEALGTATMAESFPLNSISLGTEPTYMVEADFNGDGIPDFAMIPVNNSVTSITVLLGKGDGTFTTVSTSFSAISAYSQMAVGDFNGDGIPDLVITPGSSGPLQIWLGNGDGTFTLKSSYAVSVGGPAVGDFNGDGNADIAVIDNYSNQDSIAVLLGNGDGTFTVKTQVATTPDPTSLQVADFNGDGIPDLAVVNYGPGTGGSTMSILLSNGDGTFTAKSTLTSVSSYDWRSCETGDFNGDGIPDIAVGNGISSNAQTASIFLGKGDGTFTLKSTPNVAQFPGEISVGDFNGDGILDLAIVSGQSASIYSGFSDVITVLLGNGDGTFTSQSTPTVGDSPLSIATADVNGDGNPDIVVTNVGDDTVSVLLNQITQTATASASGVDVPGTGPHQVQASYSGDTNYNSSNSSAITLTAAPVATGLQLTSSALSVPVGTSITFTATVVRTLAGLAPSGTVQFYDGSNALGNPISITDGAAGYATGSLSAGTHSITGQYSGDGNYASSTSPAVTVQIQGIAVAASNSSASVSPGGSVTETVTVTDEGGLNGTTTFTCSELPQGAACAFNPQTVAGSGSTTLTLTTAGATTAMWVKTGGTILACVILLFGCPGRRFRSRLLLSATMGLLIMTAGCGGGGNANTSGGGGGGSATPAGTYTITVMASTNSGGNVLSQKTSFQLTVN